MKVARWIQSRSEIKRVMYPALPEDPGHEIWKRDFDRATGLFGVLLHPVGDAAIKRMVEGMSHFRMGYSWGGYESLLLPLDPRRGVRTASEMPDDGMVLRISVGLEDPDDLIDDLSRGLDRLRGS